MRHVTFDLGPFPDAQGFEEAIDKDRNDPLASFRDDFVITDPDLIYLDGNSLGRLPEATSSLLSRVLEQEWGDRLIRSWNEGWWDLQLEIGDRIAGIIGASPGEVVVSDSTSVNLYKLAMAVMGRDRTRATIVTDDLNFPTDVYVLDAVAAAHGGTLEVVDTGGFEGAADAVSAAMDASTALVSMSHTTFKSGFVYDLEEITARAHDAGALMLWDLSHSAGVYPIDLNGVGADLAVGCTYKYLSGGPGSPAFLYVRSDLQSSLRNPIRAWWGHAEPFSFEPQFRPVDGNRRFHTGTMPVLALAPIAAGLALVEAAGTTAIRAKAVSLGQFAVSQWEEHLAGLGFVLESPRDPALRGSHISLAHPEAWPIARAMIELCKLVPDFRAPDSLRVGLSPLYTRHRDVHTAVQRMKSVVETGLLDGFAATRLTVT